MNRVVLMGNLTRDPEKVDTKSGADLTTFAIAINSKRTLPSGEQKEEVTFVNCKCFGKNAININKYFHKGRKILIEGKLDQERWEKDGVKKSKMVVIAEKFNFCDSPDKNYNDNNYNNNLPISYDSI